MAWASGQRLQGGKYTIEQELGQGGFGITYRVINNDGRLFALKTLNDQVQRRPDFAKFQQDFLNEALRLAKCSHPYVVRIDEVIQEGALWGIVMEYIDGEDLASRVKKIGALFEAEALQYIQQISEALTVVHNNGLLHRDIKPTNIMLRPGNSEAVLIDFGIAREFIPNLPQTHTQFLSDSFAPIEQYEKRAKRGAYTDVYALAATLYFLLTAEEPTPAPLRAIGTQLDPPKQINPDISDRVNQAIIKGMEVKPEKRPQSIQEWLALLVIPAPAIECHKPPQTQSVSLLSGVEVDYRKLRDLLAAEEWRKADEETRTVMLLVARRKREGWIRDEDIDQFHCQDLRTIEQLWVTYSYGWFGFSAQKQIWQDVGKQYKAFGNRVGWRNNGEWLSLKDLNFNLGAPKGHLPIVVCPIGWGDGRGWWWGWLGESFLSSSKLVRCNIISDSD